jgi:hypothetical protein
LDEHGNHTLLEQDWGKNDAIPSLPHATASPSVMQDRELSLAIASTISGNRLRPGPTLAVQGSDG